MTTHDHSDHDPDTLGLHADDARALDALIDAGFEPECVEPELQFRATRIAQVLGALDQTPAHLDGELTDRVIASIRASIRDTREQSVQLGARDGEALEACVMNGFDPARAPSALRERAERHDAIRRAVTTLDAAGEQWIAAGRRVRTERVIDAVTSADAATIPFEQPRRVRGFRIGDLIAAAAMLLLASAVVLPVTNSMGESGRRAVCMSNLQAAGLGLGLYAMSNDDSLPMATAGFGGSWSQVGNPVHSQSANLFTLVRTKHVPWWALTCPGNANAPKDALPADAVDWRSLDEVSYSYRLMPRGSARLDELNSGSVVLADRSPVLLAGLRGRSIDPEAASPNHEREGQHLLRVDDSVEWAASPVLPNGDNIWLPRVVEQQIHSVRKKYGLVDGYELPASTEDTFLGP
ncbi:MAG: hypothetical protein H6810_10065 [Phycisphaeraceae bacterium]|nr:MAG: hypothetical protein H6810_10065 [Phycisphaeraceae bacterium]